MKSNIDVSIIIINYNTIDLTIESINSVYTHTKGIKYEIIVIDNASKEGMLHIIKDTFPEVILVENKTNLGFGNANNLGIQLAKGEFIFLLNSDAFLTSNALLTFTTYMRQPQNDHVAVCGGELFTGRLDTTVSYGNLPSLLDAFSSIGFFKLYKKYHYKYIASGVANTDPTTREVGYISGADMFIRKSVMDQAGTFDKDFFLYFEETEMAFRFKQKGFISVILPHVKIIHLGSASQKGKNSFNYVNFFHFCRGRNLYFLKCHGKIYSLLTRCCYALNEINLSLIGKRNGNIFKKLNSIFFAK